MGIRLHSISNNLWHCSSMSLSNSEADCEGHRRATGRQPGVCEVNTHRSHQFMGRTMSAVRVSRNDTSEREERMPVVDHNLAGNNHE
jgi:hypothetical protein